MAKDSKKRLKPAQLDLLPISVGEAKKLLGATNKNMDDDDVARKILLLTELARLLIKTLHLQK